MTVAHFVLLGACAIQGIAYAAPLWPICMTGTLQEYMDQTQPCEVGDKSFFDFEYVGIGPLAVAPEDILVTPIIGPNVGLRFSGPFEVDGIDLVSETFFAFRVATLSGEPTIVRAIQQIDASFTGLGAVSVDERIDDGTLLGQGLNGRTSLISTQLIDFADLNPSSEIRVTKDVFLTSGVLGSASLVYIDQIFEQTVPEPSTVALAITGFLFLVGANLTRSRRR